MNFKRYHVSKNLFDKDNASVKTLYIDNSTDVFRTSSNAKTVIIPCEPNTTYTISKIKSTRFIVAYSAQIPVASDVAYGTIENNTGTAITITTDNNAAYLSMFIYNVAYDTLSFEDIVDTIMVNTGSQPLPYEPYSSEVWHNVPYYIHNTSADTITTLPVDIYANDTTAIVGLKGNTVQNGTPTPESPVMPQGTGERTGNLFDVSATDIMNGYVANGYLNTNGEERGSNFYNISEYIDISGLSNINVSSMKPSGSSGSSTGIGLYDSNKILITSSDYAYGNVTSKSFSVPSNAKYVRISYNKNLADGTMLNSGSTALSYEPYGYKLPITCGHTITPVYLGEAQSIRQIKKLVLTGEESYTLQSINSYGVANFYIYIPATRRYAVCTHFKQQTTNISNTQDEGFLLATASGNRITFYIRIFSTTASTKEEMQAYVAQQYANGTPVTIWYVLDDSETGTANEPLMKIGDYTDSVSNISIPVIAGGDTISVGTTVQPSEVTVNYKGWHPVADVHERDNGAWT